ncbi:hypothetical protein KFE98_03590 [bacterium SCSIO 12741]|nr:hypothetical protein KFE98_03590 [bacterium SCSIO 12741]
MSKVDNPLVRELKREEEYEKQKSIIREANYILRNRKLEEVLIEQIQSPSSRPTLSYQVSESSFCQSSIRTICLRYRLRFLPLHLYKGDIPPKAQFIIHKYQDLLGMKAADFRIAAPAEKFQLRDCTNDPLLFLRVGDDRFLLVHQWGRDMSRFRKVISYPWISMSHLIKSVIMVSLLLTLIFPDSLLLADQASTGMRIQLHGYLFLVTGGLLFFASLIYGVMTSQDFSSDNWNDKYFN